MGRIIIVGKGGSGKDYLAKKFIERGFKKDISSTTRPPRENEEHGINYFFLSEEDFMEKVRQGFFYEHKSFNGWLYGCSNEEWHSKNVFIMTPPGVASIRPADRKDCMVIYLDIPEEVRRERLEQRNDADTVERRLQADEEDFKDFKDFDIRITNPEF